MVTRRAFLRSGVVWTGLLWVPKAAAQQSALPPRVRTFSKPTVAAGSDVPAGALLSEDFEGAGTPAGWGASGAVDFDEAVTVLDGSQSLEIDSTATSPYVYKAYTEQANVQHFFDWQFHTTPGSTRRFAEFTNAAFSTVGYLTITTDPKIRIEPAGGTATLGTAVLSVDTHYRVWMRYSKGSGANASFEVWISTTDSKADAVDHFSVSDGTATTDSKYIWLQPQSGSGLMYYDRVRVDSF